MSAAEHNMSVADIQLSLIERDNRDKNREIAPLIVPEGAHTIDNSELSIKEIVKNIIDIIDSLR